MFELLTCKCNACTHWEIVYDVKEGNMHLLCKTCNTKCPFVFSNLTLPEGVHWVERNNE